LALRLLVTVLIFVVGVERKLTGGGLEQHRDYAPYVGRWDKLVAAGPLGSHVVAGSRALLAPTVGTVGDAEPAVIGLGRLLG